ncbi:MAG TPA: ABC transporter permease [Bryobacteraceae bacterium]|nr:ABC transporter permease [Bryobacteraceae bacterium]
MPVGYENPEFELDSASRTIHAKFRIINQSNETWRRDQGYALGWQIYDPETGTFIEEGEWTQLQSDLAPAQMEDVELALQLPPERGRYHIYISPLHAGDGWFYQRGDRFLLADAAVEAGAARLLETGITTLRSLRRRNLWRSCAKAFRLPFRTILENRGLIRSMVRRDILARYRGSFGDVLWTVLNPLLLMATYFFVFGVVMQSRFGADNSRTGFVLYFLAGMLPWLPFSEAVGRSPHVIVEHRNFVKKLVFPVETLPVNLVFAGLVTEAFAMAVFLPALLLIRGHLPPTVLWLPVLLIPQMMFTLGLSWFLSALGVYVRDLGQVMGFLLTLWFFLMPICYPETSWPHAAAVILMKNPFYHFVRGYREIFLEGTAPAASAMIKLWLLSFVVFIGGHAWFHKLRKSFADVV